MENSKKGQSHGNRKTLAKIVAAVIVTIAIVAALIATISMIGKDKTGVGSDFHNELFGENVYIFSPEDDPAKIQAIIDEVYKTQETNQFGKERYAFYFLPGEYDESLLIDVGYYTQVAGLGILPTDTKLEKLQCLARWLGDDSNHNACCNFWRGVENITMNSNTVWAVSQATDMRRVQVNGALYLHDEYGWCSGGFLSDSYVETMIDSGSQQQWLSRNNWYNIWMGENWNMVFVGDGDCAPTATWPVKPYTAFAETPEVREKPFLFFDEKEGYCVFVPNVREDSVNTTWKDVESTIAEKRKAGITIDQYEELLDGSIIKIEDFYVAHEDTDTADTINQALAEGKHLLFTPGIYEIHKPIQVMNPNTVVLGMGLATLQSVDGSGCMEVADEEGIIVAGLLFDAGEETESLLVVGREASTTDDAPKTTPICLSDVYFRVGGTAYVEEAKVQNCVTIHSSDVIGDNFWVWRADHGDGVAWDTNTAPNGIIINGDRVTMYALMVEHFHEYQTIWNGNEGRVYMYQSEIPYDVPTQEVWKSHDGTVDGYASFYVDEKVTDFFASGLGIYLYNRDAEVYLNSAMEVPDCDGVRVEHICTVMLNGNPGMNHVINNTGKSATTITDREILLFYENGQFKD